MKVENAVVQLFEDFQNLFKQLEAVKVGRFRLVFFLLVLLLANMNVKNAFKDFSDDLNCVLKQKFKL